MAQKVKRTRKPLSNEAQKQRSFLKSIFPEVGKVRAKQAAAYLEIGESTFWKMLADKRIDPPLKLGKRVSVWDAQYIRQLAENGIPEAPAKEAA